MLKAITSALLATKNFKLRNQLSTILMQHNYTVINIKSAIESISQALEHQVDFMILDLESYNANDKVAIDIIKKERPKVPIIVLTEDNSLETVRELTHSGVFYVAIKPIQKNKMEILIEAINNYNRGHKQVNYLNNKNHFQSKII